MIESPIPPLRRLQKQVAEVLAEIYQPRPCVNGFVRERGIVTNAKGHVRRTWLVNVDLEDFFHSVHFGRVLRIFEGWRFEFSRPLARDLANLCCYKGRLPQGAPTSPILSNIACDALDKALINYAKTHSSYYSRYSDDLTFSTRKRDLPQSIALHSGGEPPSISDHLREIIESYRFKVNDAKTRVRHCSERQDVTGLVVNVRTNVPRRLVRQIRAMLTDWARQGIERAQEAHRSQWDKKDRRPGRMPPQFKKVVRGKIEFLGHVRGQKDPIYVKFLRWYTYLEPNARSKVLEMVDAERREVFLCHASEDKEAVVNALSEALKRANISHFLDAKEIFWGDSVTGTINVALARSRFVIAVVSKASLRKQWPMKEMNAALAREISEGRTLVLPLIHAKDDADFEEVKSQLFLQGDKRFLRWKGVPDEVVSAIQDLLQRGKV